MKGFLVRRAALLAPILWIPAALAVPVDPNAGQIITIGPGSTQWEVRNDVGTDTGEPFSGECDDTPAFGIRDAQGGSGDGDAYDEAWLTFINGAPFVAPNPAELSQTFLNGPITYTAGPVLMSGVNVSVEYTFFSDRQLMRMFVILANPGLTARTVTVQIPINFGSDTGTVVRGTSSGDTTFDNLDRWVVTSDATASDPVNTTVFAGSGFPAVTPDLVTSTVFSCSATNGVGVGFTSSVTIPQGSSRALMFFAGLGDVVSTGNTIEGALENAPVFDLGFGALSQVGLLDNMPVLAGQILNWDFAPVPRDYGDAPAPYPTLLSQDGARHLSAEGPYLGTAPPDLENDGQPSADALGDDSDVTDDEDGVVTLLHATGGASVARVTVSGADALLDGWVDFNQDGDWNDPGEQIFDSQPVHVGINDIPFIGMNTTNPSGPVYARYRISTAGGLAPTGQAADGEVEDYILQPIVDPNDNTGTGNGGNNSGDPPVLPTHGGAVPLFTLGGLLLTLLWRRRRM